MPSEDVFEDDLFAALYDCANLWSVSDDFYLDRALENGGPVLDIGCGTGMLASAIAAKGLAVTGVDPAEAMLRVARARPGADRVTWIQSDGQSLRLPQKFNFIYMTGHAFQQLLTDDDADQLLGVAAEHLNPDGRLIFDTRNPAAQAWLSWTPQHTRRMLQCPQQGLVAMFYDADAEPTTGIVTIREHYHFLTTEIRRVGCNRIRFIDQDHLSRLLTKAGLVPGAWYGDWAGSPFSTTSKEIIVVTRRAL